MIGVCENVKITGISSCVPSRILDNIEFAESTNDKHIKRQVKLTGIRYRHCVSGNQRTSDLASVAAKELLMKNNWDTDSISALVFVTQSPDINAPSTAMIIQKKLSIGKDCIAFDVNLGCSGFTSGLIIMASLLKNIGGRGLLLMGDCQHYAPNTEFTSDAMLFGDAGAAVSMEYSSGGSIVFSQNTDGSRYTTLYSPLSGGRVMDGNAILLFSIDEVAASIKALFEDERVISNPPDFCVLHQAQKIIMDGIIDNSNSVKEKFLFSCQDYGNTSSASIPVTLCHSIETIQNAKKETVRIFGCGYGIGLSWSSVVFEINSKCIYPVIVSDECL